MARTTPDTFAAAARPHELGPHVVDQLIMERAPSLRTRPLIWSGVRAVFYPLLGYARAVKMADRLAPMGGRLALNWMSTFMRLQTVATGLRDVPKTGPVVVVANHPGGIADGVAVWDALMDRRPDVVFFANRDALRVCPGLDDVIIPVEWRLTERSRERMRETLKAAAAAFKEGKLVVIFPAGRMAQWDWNTQSLEDPEWMPTAVTLARKYNAPIVPLGVRARMSLTYYGLAQVSQELKNMTLFSELIKARGKRYRLRFAPPVHADELPDDPSVAVRQLRLTSQALATRF